MERNFENLPEGARTLMEKFSRAEAVVGVVGLGYVGLPLAVVLGEAGFQVIGVDRDESKIETLREGKSYIDDVSDHEVHGLIQSGKLLPSTSYADLVDADGVSLCVPTPLRKTGDPDLSFIISATRDLLPHLHSPMVVILESTTYPGTTREMVMPEIEKIGLGVGKDIFLAFSPERVDPGRMDWTTRNTPKIIGGVTDTCTAVASAMYGQAIESIVEVSSSEVAEMTKLLENTFRAVNIGLVNEMALMCHRLGIDVWEVIDAAATKPFGFMKFTPGPGLGGHCIPIDPLYLSWKLKSVKYTARFIELASEINTNMPRVVVQRIQDALNERGKSLKGSEVLILGAAYKPDVEDIRESPALDVIGLLMEKGAEVSYYDPHVPHISHEGWQMSSEKGYLEKAGRVDCVVIITNHSTLDYRGVCSTAKLILDTRNAMKGVEDPEGKVVKL